MSWKKDFTHYPEVALVEQKNGSWKWEARLYSYAGGEENTEKQGGIAPSRDKAIEESQKWIKDNLEKYRRTEE